MDPSTKTSDRLQRLGNNYRESIVNTREGEQRFGQTVQLADGHAPLSELLTASNCEVVVLGINEDIGVRANFGRAGTAEAFEQSLPHLFALQHNRYLPGENVMVLGQINFNDLDGLSRHFTTSFPDDIMQLRKMVEHIDSEVYKVAKTIFDAGKKLVVIGGGHNNAYPLIKALADSKGAAASVLNFDPHADLRDAEGRHSGNGFTYALNDKSLGHYHIFGMAESANNAQILERIDRNEHISATCMERILDEGLHRMNDLLSEALNAFPNDRPVGMEIDMDVLTHFPASAVNSSGFTGNQLRSLVRAAFAQISPSYVHLCEAAPNLSNSKAGKSQAANFLARLTGDVVKKLME